MDFTHLVKWFLPPIIIIAFFGVREILQKVGYF
ncbi:MAG: hypothetical protein KCCBMMGE_01959 [Candidatus Methanoperedenaceae archaeon GB37]|nr:MAG: hypothetical protein KCCBMMGE_01959 [Candidatus Methanoperedenaceae archaeon GB37]